MMRRHPGAQEPDRARTYPDLVHGGEIAWLSDTGCHGGYHIPMVAFDEAPWDRFIDKPLGAAVCPACRKAMKLSHTCGGHGSESLDEPGPPAVRRPPRCGEHVIIRGAA